MMDLSMANWQCHNQMVNSSAEPHGHPGEKLGAGASSGRGEARMSTGQNDDFIGKVQMNWWDWFHKMFNHVHILSHIYIYLDIWYMYSFSIFICYHTFVYVFLGGMAAFWLAPLCAGCDCARHGDRFAGPNSSWGQTLPPSHHENWLFLSR